MISWEDAMILWEKAMIMIIVCLQSLSESNLSSKKRDIGIEMRYFYET